MRLPPTGTVTFLFTDVQGSTGLWESGPDAMRVALARHDSLLRRAIAENGGFVFKTIGDAFCAAFATAPEALAGALAAQIALAAEPWGLPTPLLVRMGLHTGSAEERDGDYFGPPLNRAARLMAAGHGGQTLLSLAAQELTRDSLPPLASLADLGGHRLKDLGRPETVFQLLHPALPADFPPLNSLGNPSLPNNLPPQVTSFIGREAQVAQVKALLGKSRLLTLTGAGGSGKTRLSLQVAADLLDGAGDGVWLVELAVLSDPALVPQAVAQVLGVREEPGKGLAHTLADWLRPRRLLLILDNCEHLVAACAALAADILRGCPQVHILASSREPLAVAGEQTYRVPSLSLPDPKGAQTAEGLSQYEAVRLFIERARAVQPSFSVTDASAPAVAQVCFHLDGIPLAIELAAARVRSLSAEEINARLDQRFRLLTGGARGALPRQQTLRALIDWSYDLLSVAEKALLRRLSVFAGGWTLEVAEAVCAGDDIEDWEVLDTLTGLVDKSLVVYEEGEGGTGRLRLLETVRQYAGERLGEVGEAEAVCGRAAAWFLALAEEAEPQLTGPEQAAWLSRLEAEHDNLRAGLSWYLSQEERPPEERPNDGGLRLATALWRFWFVRGHLSEGRRWLDLALAQAGAAGGEALGAEASAARARALNGAGNLASNQGDFVGARAAHEESLALFRRAGDQSGIANALCGLGLVAHRQGDHAGARMLHEEGLTLFRQSGDQSGIADVLGYLGMAAYRQGDYAGARALYEESLALFRQLRGQSGIANALCGLGLVAHQRGDYAEARALHEESLALYRRLGSQSGIADVLGCLGMAAYRQGDYAGARAAHEESLTLFRQLGRQQAIANALANLAVVAHRQGQMGRAARLSGAAAGLRESIGSRLVSVEREEMDAMLDSAAKALGEAAFAAAWDAGRAMTLDGAVESALREE